MKQAASPQNIALFLPIYLEGSNGRVEAVFGFASGLYLLASLDDLLGLGKSILFQQL
jgi:hypothetical protein